MIFFYISTICVSSREKAKAQSAAPEHFPKCCGKCFEIFPYITLWLRLLKNQQKLYQHLKQDWNKVKRSLLNWCSIIYFEIIPSCTSLKNMWNTTFITLFDKILSFYVWKDIFLSICYLTKVFINNKEADMLENAHYLIYMVWIGTSRSYTQI